MTDNDRPSIANSTRDERLAYVRSRYACISDCDMCGVCATFGSTGPEGALADYIDGKIEFRPALLRFRQSQKSR